MISEEGGARVGFGPDVRSLPPPHRLQRMLTSEVSGGKMEGVIDMAHQAVGYT